jgi:hypothetical protein
MIEIRQLCIPPIPRNSMAKKHWLLAASAASLGALTACTTSPQTTDANAAAKDLRASVFGSSAQSHAAVDVAPDGSYMVAWDSRRQEGGTYGVFARAFDASGNALSHEIHVNQTMPGMQYKPTVAFAADGSAWFAWESHGQDGSGSSVVARKFENVGGKFVAAGAEIAVNHQRQDDQAMPVLATNQNGDVLAVFADQLPADEFGVARFELRARSLATAANAQGVAANTFASPNGNADAIVSVDSNGTSDIAISTPGIGSDMLPSVTNLSDGSFLVTWARSHANDQSGIWARQLNADGTIHGAEFRLSTNPTAIEPSIDSLPNGEFVATWLVEHAKGYAIEAARFQANGKRKHGHTVATPEDGWKSGAAVTASSDGRYLIAYNTERPTSVDGAAGGVDRDIVMQWYNAEGELQKIEKGTHHLAGNQILTAASGTKRVLWTDQGDVVLAWDGDAGMGDSSAAHLSIHHKNGASHTDFHSTAALAMGEPQAAVLDFNNEDHAAIPPIWDPNWTPQDRLMTIATSGDFGFEAIPGTGWTPPDPEMAIGPDHIIGIVNGRIACFNRTGSELWGTAIESNGFWGAQGAGGFVFDPEACWDPHAQRFLAMACERTGGRSYFLFAISKNDSPTTSGDWHKYRWDVTSISGDDIDSPNMSLSNDTIMLTADFFGPDKYLIYLIDKASVLSGGTASTTHELITGSKQQSMGIPVVQDNTGTLYIAQTTENSNNTTVILHAITDPFTSYNRQTYTVSVEPYTYPAHPPQKGSSSKPYLFEPRFWSCAQANDAIWAVHHVDNSRSRARWYEFDLNGWPNGGNPTVNQWGEIDLGGGIYTYFPSIAVDMDNNAAITYARSSSKEYISMGRAVRAASDPLNQFRPGQVVRLSSNSHNSGRWGDYSGTQADPFNANTFWGHHEWTNGSTSSWRTWIARYDIQPTEFDLTELTLTAGTTAVLESTGAPAGARVYFAYSTTSKGLYEIPALSTTLSLENPILIGSATADAAGTATISKSIPNAAQGMKVWIQSVIYGRTSTVYPITIQ